MGIDDGVSVYFIRHGLTQWNKEKRYLGHSDEPLLPELLYDSRLLKQQLSTQSLDQIFTSDLRRCMETTEYLVPDKPACADPNLREIDFGDWEGKTHHELENDPMYQHWINHWQMSAPPHGENYQSFRKRVRSFLNDILKRDDRKNVLVVTHGGVIREVMNGFIPALSFADSKIPHGKGVRMLFNQSGGDWKCSSWSAVPIVEKEN
ncbi:histidine phosphatase family protein [Halobacillus sp. MO56]